MGEGKKKRLVEKSDVRGSLTRRTEIFSAFDRRTKIAQTIFFLSFENPKSLFIISPPGGASLRLRVTSGHQRFRRKKGL